MSEKEMGITDMERAAVSIPDLKVFGDPGRWICVCKASSESQGWMKSTKAMAVPRGCLVQVTTQQRNPDGTWSLAEALVHIPGVNISDLIVAK